MSEHRGDRDTDAITTAREGASAGPTRREVLAWMGAGALAASAIGCAPSEEQSPDAPSPLAEPLYDSSVRALAAAIRRGDLSSEELVTACLDRIEAVNGQLNAVVQLASETALARAREADEARSRGESWGALHGVPMTIKDSLDTAGIISTGGTQGRASHIPERDATVVARLKEAGAILLGKTNTPELTLSFETDNLIYGRTSNPYDLSRTSGGSSGGAAAIVAAGGAPFDIGSDYGGSIRLPSHFCGIAGIKPTSGRVPRTGHIYPFGGVQDAFQQIGPLARYVDDLSLILPVIAGPDGIDPGVGPMPLGDPSTVDLGSLRVSFHSDNGIATPTPETITAVEAAAADLEGAVAGVQELQPPAVDEAMELIPLYFWDGGAAIERLLREAGTTENTLGGFTAGPAVSALELDRLITASFSFRSRLHSFMTEWDAIICPVNAGPALPHGGTADPESLALFSYTFTHNVSGLPGAVVRRGTSPEGLPIGVQIVAAPGREDVALALAAVIEDAGGFRPPAL